MAMEYKVCFHMSYPLGYVNPTRPKRRTYNGKMHYCGRTLEEAVDKVRDHVMYAEAVGGKCTSMWVMRGREKGLNITWEDYKAGKYKAPE